MKTGFEVRNYRFLVSSVISLIMSLLLGISTEAVAQSFELLATVNDTWGPLQNDTLVSVNPTTGAQTQVGTAGATQPNTIALNPQTGLLYGAWSIQSNGGNGTYLNNSTIMQINKSNGSTTTVTTVTDTPLTSIAFSAGGTLYGSTIYSGTTANQIGTIDLSTGAFTPIVALPVNTIAALAFSPTNGLLYASVENLGGSPYYFNLDAINVSQKTILSSTQINGAFAIDNMTFAPDGSEIFFTNYSYWLGKMDLNGNESGVGSGQLGDISGIAAVPVSTPEPSTFLLLGASLAGLAVMRLRRRNS